MRRIFTLITLCFILVSTACASSNEREFSKLVEQAEAHYHDAEYSSAIEVYRKALDIKEDKETRSSLENIENEVERMREVREIYAELKTTPERYTNVLTATELLGYVQDVRDVLVKINAFDTSPFDFPAGFVDKITSSVDYESLSRDLEILEGAYTIGLSSNNPFEDSERLTSKINKIVDKYPIPAGFASYNAEKGAQANGFYPANLRPSFQSFVTLPFYRHYLHCPRQHNPPPACTPRTRQPLRSRPLPAA